MCDVDSVLERGFDGPVVVINEITTIIMSSIQ